MASSRRAGSRGARSQELYDDTWRRTRAPYLPADFDARFLQAAPADLVYPGYLRGGEPVEIINASPAGPQRFRLPECEIEAVVQIAASTEKAQLRIETLLLEPGQQRFSLVFRGDVPCDKRALRVEEVRLETKVMRGVEG